MNSPVESFLHSVSVEVGRVDAKLGADQDAPSGDGCGPQYADVLKGARYINELAIAGKVWTWADILREEFFEVLTETDREHLKSELVQVAAVCARWHRALEGRAP
jgi:hypothetical protein